MQADTQEAEAVGQPGTAAAIIGPHAGAQLRFTAGEQFVWKATGAGTGGVLDAGELTVAPLAGPPAHVHDQNDEVFYVLEGTFLMRVGQQIQRAGSGAFIFIPRGTPHVWRNVGTQPGRMLTLFVPGGMDSVFRRARPADGGRA